MKLRKSLIKISMKDKVIIVLFLIFICSKLIFNYINRNIVNVLETIAKNETTNVATIIINDGIDNLDFKMEYIKTIMNKNEEIVSVDFDTKNINSLLVKLNKRIYNDLKKFEKGEYNIDNSLIENKNYIYKIPFSLITNNYILSNIGPKIPMKASIIGNVISNIETLVTPYGINNSLLKIYIKVEVSIRLVLPLISETIKVTDDVPVLIKVINGVVPDVYGGSYAVTSPITSSK